MKPYKLVIILIIISNSGKFQKLEKILSKAFSRKRILFIKNLSNFRKTVETGVDPRLGEATPGLFLKLFHNEKENNVVGHLIKFSLYLLRSLLVHGPQGNNNSVFESVIIDNWIQEPLEEIHLARIRSYKIREFFKQSLLQH